MLSNSCKRADLTASAEVETEAMRYLSDLTPSGSVLIVAADMPKAVITRDNGDGVPQRIAVLDRHLAEAMALMDWIICRNQGRVSSYVISPAGCQALRGFRASQGGAKDCIAENDDCAPRRMR